LLGLEGIWPDHQRATPGSSSESDFTEVK